MTLISLVAPPVFSTFSWVVTEPEVRWLCLQLSLFPIAALFVGWHLGKQEYSAVAAVTCGSLAALVAMIFVVALLGSSGFFMTA